MLSNIFVIEDSIFGKIKNFDMKNLPVQVFKDFAIQQFENNNFNIFKISNLYILIGDYSSQIDLEDDEDGFEDILNEVQYAYLLEHKKIILGYMMVTKSKIRNDTHYIDWIETCVKKCNIADCMIKNYKLINNEIKLIPRIFGNNSIDYWFYKQNWNAYSIYVDYIEHLIHDFNLYDISEEIDWKDLYIKIEEEKNKNIQNDIII